MQPTMSEILDENIIKKTDKVLIVRKTDETPAIILNPEKAKFQIVATSWPENAITFYKPVFKWFENYFEKSPLDKTVIEFRMDYFNTSTKKQFAILIDYLGKCSKKHDIVIQWYYYDDDPDMKHEGVRLSKSLGVDFEMIEKESRDDNAFDFL